MIIMHPASHPPPLLAGVGEKNSVQTSHVAFLCHPEISPFKMQKFVDF